jgi:two-component system, cell cycle response regulator
MCNLLNKVLIADDDPAIVRILQAHLTSGGYEVFAAADGRQALELIEQHHPSYLITDWDMPEVDGVELCRRVRQLDLPGYLYIVFLTSRSGQDDLMGAMEAGADDFLNKPLRKDELLARLGAGARILRLESRLSALAAHDTLSELPTRRAFHVMLSKEWDRAHRYRLPLSVVMFDIDYFKRINDTYGHLVGDEVIRAIAKLLRQQSRTSDVLCRYGGEEFVVLLPETDEASAAIWAERLRQRIADEPILGDHPDIRLTISLGVTEMLAEIEDKEEFLTLVDQCLLAAKEQGRNQVVSFRTLVGHSGHLTSGSSIGASVLEGVLARDAMIPLFHCVGPDWSVAQASAYFLRYRVSSVPVTDAAGNLLGIISEKDVLGIAHTPQAPKRRVDEVMRSNVVVYDEAAPLANILSFLTRAPIRSVVITCQGKPCGLASRAAIVRWFLENRWNARQSDLLAGQSAESGNCDRIEADPMLNSLADQLVEMASELRHYLRAGAAAADPAPLIGGASRMQLLLEELLTASPRFASVQHGLPS